MYSIERKKGAFVDVDFGWHLQRRFAQIGVLYLKFGSGGI